MYIFVNGEILPEEKAVISAKDRGFKFGDGVYETIAVYDGVAYQWDLHIERLKVGLKEIKLEIDLSSIYNDFQNLISKNNLANGIVRISISRGSGSVGYLPTYETGPTVVIESMAKPNLPTEPVNLWLSSLRKVPAKSFPIHIKTMQGLNSALSRMEAKENGYFEALLLGSDDQICECASGNIFWFKGDVLYTPSLASGILPGTTRDAVIRLSPYEVKEEVFKLDDLKSADEVFITNVVWQALPVAKLDPDNFSWDKTEKTTEIQELLKNDIFATKKTAVA